MSRQATSNSSPNRSRSSAGRRAKPAAKLVAYQHARPALAVDCVVFGFDGEKLQVLLVQRDQAPHEGRWALPGGFVRVDESVDDAARRELIEETSISISYLEQLYTFGAVDRDPRDRVVSVAYFALVRSQDHTALGNTDARTAAWFDEADVPKLAFDHDEILRVARTRLQDKVRWRPIGFDLLPAQFTLTQLQRLYETILKRPLDKRNFRKKLLAMDLLDETGAVEEDVKRRPARLYRFRRVRYDRLTEQGLVFEL
jgi:8-oxo-dGTP diphosphatase